MYWADEAGRGKDFIILLRKAYDLKHALLISRISHLIFLDCDEPQITEIAESKTMDKW
jgi:hypothetical protein